MKSNLNHLQQDSIPNDLYPLKNKDQKQQLISEDWSAIIGAGFFISLTILLEKLNHNLTLPIYNWKNLSDLSIIFSGVNLLKFFKIGLLMLIPLALPIVIINKNVNKFIFGYLLIYLAAGLCIFISKNRYIMGSGIDYIAFSICIGLSVSALPKLIQRFTNAIKPEIYVKTGIILLGTSILWTDLLSAGLLSLGQGLIVVAGVWTFSFWIGRKLKIDDEFGAIIASAVSICGVSAAIIVAGIINADRKKLSNTSILVILTAIPMILILPLVSKYLGLSSLVSGAWLGGTIDTTSAVAAATSLVTPLATKIGLIVKFSQNALIGFVALFIAIWWVKKQKSAYHATTPMSRPRPWVILRYFPKFLLAFIIASAVFSFSISKNEISHINPILQNFRSICFAMAFICIGIEVNSRTKLKLENKKPIIVFIAAQLFNILWTLAWAYIIFGGKYFAMPNFNQ